jgi:uncharacterized membrane protein
MRTVIYALILFTATVLFSISLLYLDKDPYDSIGSHLIGYSMLLYIFFIGLAILDILRYLVVLIIKLIKKVFKK